MNRSLCALALAAIVGLSGRTLADAQTAQSLAGHVGSLKLIGIQTVPNDLVVDNTPVGGLSGIDYDPVTGNWVIFSDDKSDNAPARFYTANLTYDASSFSSVDIAKATSFLQADGTVYPNAKAGGEVPDPESIRIDPQTGDIWWTSEGSRKLGLDPFVREVDPTGKQLSSLPLPPIFKMNMTQEIGPRDNLTFEGLTFAPDGNSLWVSLEEPLYQDGPQPTPDAGGVVRFTHYDRDGKVLGQLAYDEDPIQAVPGGQSADNGVSEILAVDDTHFLVLERSGVQGADGSYKDYIRVYLADTTGATDISNVVALQGATYTPMSKQLIFNFATDPAISYVDNLEGMSWGPRLADGNSSLVIEADNNFNDSEITQFFAFEVLPTSGATASPVAGATPVS